MTALLLQPSFSAISLKTIREGLEQTIWAGRCEWLGPNLMLDGAHNEDSIAKLVDLLKTEFADKTIHILFAGLRRKPLAHLLEELADFDVAVTTFDFIKHRPWRITQRHTPRFPITKTGCHRLMTILRTYL